jgi:hypothetical protein
LAHGRRLIQDAGHGGDTDIGELGDLALSNFPWHETNFRFVLQFQACRAQLQAFKENFPATYRDPTINQPSSPRGYIDRLRTSCENFLEIIS